MLNAILSLFRMILLILGGYEQVAQENLALREQLAIFQRSVRHPKTRPTDVLGVPAEGLEGVEVCIGDCQARDRPRLAKEAFHTLLVPIIPAQETRPTWDQCRYPKTG